MLPPSRYRAWWCGWDGVGECSAAFFLFLFFGGFQVGEWVVEENGESEDSSDTSTIASADGEQSSLADMMAAVKVLLEGLGEDVTRDGLLKTPLRVARAFQGATGGTYSLYPFLLKCSPSSSVQSKGLVWGWEAPFFRIFSCDEGIFAQTSPFSFLEHFGQVTWMSVHSDGATIDLRLVCINGCIWLFVHCLSSG